MLRMWIIPVCDHRGTALPEYGGAVIKIVRIEVGRGRAKSYGVSSAGDLFVGANRGEVMARFGLKLGSDGIARPMVRD